MYVWGGRRSARACTVSLAKGSAAEERAGRSSDISVLGESAIVPVPSARASANGARARASGASASAETSARARARVGNGAQCQSANIHFW